MSKRAASYDIDEHTYEQKEKKEVREGIETEGSHLQGRKIYKIAKGGQSGQHQPKDKVDLKIAGFDNNKAKQDKTDKAKDGKVPQSPFQFDIFKQSQGVGLFSNIFSSSNSAKSAEKAPSKDASSSEVASKSLFGGIPSSNQSSIFGSSLGSGSSLFANNNGILFGGSTNTFATGNLFGNSKITGPITAPPEEQSGDSAQLQKEQQMKVDPSKSQLKYEYKQTMTIIQKILVSKYKKDKGDLMQGIQVVLSTDNKLHYLVARLAATKNVIFNGMLMPHKSKMNTNRDNIDVLVFSLGKEGLSPSRIKLQIKTENNEKDQFINNINKIISPKEE